MLNWTEFGQRTVVGECPSQHLHLSLIRSGSLKYHVFPRFSPVNQPRVSTSRPKCAVFDEIARCTMIAITIQYFLRPAFCSVGLGVQEAVHMAENGEETHPEGRCVSILLGQKNSVLHFNCRMWNDRRRYESKRASGERPGVCGVYVSSNNKSPASRCCRLEKQNFREDWNI